MPKRSRGPHQRGVVIRKSSVLHQFGDEVSPHAIRTLDIYAKYPITEIEAFPTYTLGDTKEDMDDQEQAQLKDELLQYKYYWLTANGLSRAQCVHKYILGYDIRLSPMFACNTDYEDFNLGGSKPWEIATASAIDCARAPIDHIDVDPERVVIIYRSSANIPADVITWEERRGAERNR